MATWEPQKPAELIPESVSQNKYDQMVVELTEVLYSYLYQLHSSNIPSSLPTNSREFVPTEFKHQEDQTLCKA